MDTPTSLPIAVMTSLLAVSLTAPRSAAEEDMERIEAARLEALLKGDIDAVEPLIADDFIITNSAGETYGRVEYLARLRSGRRRPASVVHDEVRTKVLGDAAIVTGRATGTLLVDGKQRPTMVRYTHVYVRHDGRWRLAAMHVSDIPRAGR